jgi:hypothetical protein
MHTLALTCIGLLAIRNGLPFLVHFVLLVAVAVAVR